MHSCTLKSLLKLFSDSDISDDERSKIEQEAMEAVTQAQLPPLGTAMYDGVWEWVYELVNETEKPKSSHVDKSQGDTQPPYSPEMATKVPQEAMDTSEHDSGNQAYLMELPNLEPVPDSTPSLPLSEQLSTESHSLDESMQPQSKASSTSADSPLTHSSVRSQLLHQCLYGVAVCAVRCPTYFKPLYRLSSVLLRLGLPKVR